MLTPLHPCFEFCNPFRIHAFVGHWWLNTFPRVNYDKPTTPISFGCFLPLKLELKSHPRQDPSLCTPQASTASLKDGISHRAPGGPCAPVSLHPAPSELGGISPFLTAPQHWAYNRHSFHLNWMHPRHQVHFNFPGSTALVAVHFIKHFLFIKLLTSFSK